MPDTTVRLHKYIASAGVSSRRKAEDLIREGRITVNGAVVTEMGIKVSDTDEIAMDGELLKPAKLYYLMMHKPKGVVTTLYDPQKRPTVQKYLPDMGVQLKPVGRLDMDTDGLLLFTNDGEFAARMTHARYGIEKEYLATVSGQVSDRTVNKLCKGLPVEGRMTAQAIFEVTFYDTKKDQTSLRIVLHEGRKRQIREMFMMVGHSVLSLRRIRIAHLLLKGLAPGECRTLGVHDIVKLRGMIGLGESASAG